MTVPGFSRLCAFAVLALAVAAPARAQIYSWRDEQGNLILSNTKHAGTPLRTFAVPEAPEVRTTRAVVAIDRARQYDELIEAHAQTHGVRADLVRAVMQVESAFNQYARSPKGALGLMQLMPETARELRVRDARDPAANIDGGARYLKELLARFGNDLSLALAAYNAGPGAVQRSGGIPRNSETQNYVPRVMARYESLRNGSTQ
jgi:soluble lytic murein transglycosylase-like protein